MKANLNNYFDVAVIGGGNVAMDAARTILRKTSAKVDIIFNRGEELVTALREELQLSLVDGASMNYYLNTIKIEPDGIIVEPIIQNVNEDGSITYTNDSDNAYKYPCSSVIIAIGQGAESNIVSNSKKNIDTIVSNMKADKFNLLILHVRPFSDSIYPSKIFPTSKYIGEVSFDVLKYFIDNYF